VDLRNVGTRRGTAVVQVYVRGPNLPIRLAGFVKVTLESGQQETVEWKLDAASLQHWDVGTHRWQTTPGRYEVLVGASSRDIRAAGEVTV
jgi:beta-glucosidase